MSIGDAVLPMSDPESVRPVAAQPIASSHPGRFPMIRSWLARPGRAALATLIIVVLLAVFAPLLAPSDPYDLATVSIMNAGLAPGEQAFDGDMTFWLGSDGAGRDVLSAILYGLRISLLVAISSTGLALAFGATLGLFSAYAGGRIDAAIMRVADLQLSFPTMLVALMLLTMLGKGLDKIIFALVLVQWAYFARTARATALVEGAKEYIEAARCLRLSHARIVFRHLLPNSLPPLIVVATIQAAHAISLEATLSFLGLGLPSTEPSLGGLISNGFQFVLSFKWWISLFPGLALLVTIVSINLVGDQLRDWLNPRLR